jgi:hypothetical protein
MSTNEPQTLKDEYSRATKTLDSELSNQALMMSSRHVRTSM